MFISTVTDTLATHTCVKGGGAYSHLQLCACKFYGVMDTFDGKTCESMPCSGCICICPSRLRLLTSEVCAADYSRDVYESDCTIGERTWHTNRLSLAIHQHTQREHRNQSEKLQQQKVYHLTGGQAVLQLAGTALPNLNYFITARIVSSFSFPSFTYFSLVLGGFLIFCFVISLANRQHFCHQSLLW